MADKSVAQHCLQSLKRQGAERAKVVCSEGVKHELNVERGKISLLRTTHDINLTATAIVAEKRGVYSWNKTDAAAIEQAAEETIGLAAASPPDPAYDIAEAQPAEDFAAGPEEPDIGLMYERLAAFLGHTRSTHPDTIIGEAQLFFNGKRWYHLNTNGVDFSAWTGWYCFSLLFTSKKGRSTSSFNYTGCFMRELDKALETYGSVADSLALSGEEINQKPLEGKFEGDIVIAPDAVGDFIGVFCNSYLTDVPLVSGTSVLKDKLGQAVAAPVLTLSSAPLSNELALNSFFTNDGFKAKNASVIEKGVLKSFLLSLYGARKTGFPRALSDGGSFIVDPGKSTREELVGAVKRGLYVRRVSGGMPNDKGDFSFIAKNSFLIEDGKIKGPVNESMVSGNIFELFRNMSGVSRERINFGSDIFPWIKADKLVISGK